MRFEIGATVLLILLLLLLLLLFDSILLLLIIKSLSIFLKHINNSFAKQMERANNFVESAVMDNPLASRLNRTVTSWGKSARADPTTPDARRRRRILNNTETTANMGT